MTVQSFLHKKCPKIWIQEVKGTNFLSKLCYFMSFKGASERFGDPAFSFVAINQRNTYVFRFDQTTFFTIRTQGLLLKLFEAAQSQCFCV